MLYGANRSMLDLAKGLKKLKQEVFFFIPQAGAINENHRLLKKKVEDYGFTCVFLNYSSSVHNECERTISERLFRKEINHECLAKMQEWAMEWKIDIIHTNSLTHNIGALLARRIKRPHVWHIRESLKKDYNLEYDNKLLYRYYLKKTEQVICISNYIQNIHKKILSGVPVQVLYDGFDTGNYIIDNGYSKFKENFIIIICGIIQEGKGQLEAVKAIKYLIEKYKVKNICLQLIGNYYGKYGEQILDFIRDNNLYDYISIIPFQEDLRELRKKADIALMCSRNEALGRVTVESMLSENLVIGANSAGTAEIVKDNVVGYLYEPGNVEELGEKIYDVITHWSQQEEIIKRAKEYAIKNFDFINYAKKVLDIYTKLI